LLTLRDAAQYITKLPKAEHEAAEWQAAMEALILVATLRGPTMFAQIGVMRALNRGHVREFNPSCKDPHWDAASWREIDEAGSRRGRSVGAIGATGWRRASQQAGVADQ
jgi:hypothetical protein